MMIIIIMIVITTILILLIRVVTIANLMMIVNLGFSRGLEIVALSQQYINKIYAFGNTKLAVPSGQFSLV